MANFIAVVDPDSERRDRFVRSVTPRVAPVDGLVTASCVAAPFELVWAARAGAPVGAACDGGVAIVFGPAIGADGTPVAAETLARRWHGAGTGGPEVLDGYYAALAWDPAAGLLAGGDVLGRFPLYYWSSGDVLLVGSSPELFRHHPSFRATFDPHGLAGILLTNGLVNGRTLWKDVRRLGAGRLLAAAPGAPPREIGHYVLPVSDRHHGGSFEEHLAIATDALDDAIRRHTRATPRPILMLSGGLDSRTIGGMLARHGVSPVAVTSGSAHEYDPYCATLAARRLGFEHHLIPYDPAGALYDAEARAAWEHCAAGFSGSGGWSGFAELRRFGTHAISGFSMDWILADPAPEDMEVSFDTFFMHHNRWGVSPDRLGRLLRREVFGDAVPGIVADLRRQWEGYARDECRRAWCYAIEHRQRFHIGGLAWPHTFGAWPITPGVDTKVLAVGGGLPRTSLRARRLQNEMLCRGFPKLAALPLDRNSDNITPLLPGLGWRVRRRLLHEFRRMVPERGGRIERRRYFANMDINGRAWLPIREAAEPLRPLAREFFHPEVFDEMVPPPDARPEFRDPITGPAGMKTLLGFLMWLARR